MNEYIPLSNMPEEQLNAKVEAWKKQNAPTADPNSLVNMPEEQLNAKVEAWKNKQARLNKLQEELKHPEVRYDPTSMFRNNPDDAKNILMGFSDANMKIIRDSQIATQALNLNIDTSNEDTSTPEKEAEVQDRIALTKMKVLLEAKDGKKYDNLEDLKLRYLEDTGKMEPRAALAVYGETYAPMEMPDFQIGGGQSKVADPLYKHLLYGMSNAFESTSRAIWANVYFASKAAHDRNLERIKTGKKDFGNPDAIKAANEMFSGFLETARMAGEVRDPNLPDWFQGTDQIDFLGMDRPEGDSFAAQVAQGIGGSLPSMILMMGGFAPLSFGMNYAQMYDEGYQQTKNHSTSVKYGIFGGIIETVGDKFLTAKIPSLMKVNMMTGILSKLGINFVSEGGTEVLQDMLLDYMDKGKIDTTKLWNTFLVGGTAGSLMGGSVETITEINEFNKQAKSDAEFIQNLDTMITESTPINWNAEGLGSIPYNVDVDKGNKGYTVLLTPEEFRKLVPEGVSKEGSLPHILEQMQNGNEIAPPMLKVNWDAEKGIWKVVGHEGRSRTDAAQLTKKGDAMPVAVITDVNQNELTQEMREAPIVAQDSDNIISPNTEHIDINEKVKAINESAKTLRDAMKKNPYGRNIQELQADLSQKVADVRQYLDDKVTPIGTMFSKPLTDSDWKNINKTFTEEQIKESLADYDGKTRKMILSAYKGDEKARIEYNKLLQANEVSQKLDNNEPLTERDMNILQSYTKNKIQSLRPDDPDLDIAHQKIREQLAESGVLSFANLWSYMSRFKLYPNLANRIRQYDSTVTGYYHVNFRKFGHQIQAIDELMWISETGIPIVDMVDPYTKEKTTADKFFKKEMTQFKLELLSGRFKQAFERLDRMMNKGYSAMTQAYIADIGTRNEGKVKNYQNFDLFERVLETLATATRVLKTSDEYNSEIDKYLSDNPEATIEDAAKEISRYKFATPEEHAKTFKELFDNASRILGKDSVKNYFPLNVKDDQVTPYRDYIRTKGIETQDGRKTVEADIKAGIAGIGEGQQRSVAKLTYDLMQFYESPGKSLNNYLLAVSRAKAKSEILYTKGKADTEKLVKRKEQTNKTQDLVDKTQKEYDDLKASQKPTYKKGISEVESVKNKNKESIDTAKENLDNVKEIADNNIKIAEQKVKDREAKVKEYQDRLKNIKNKNTKKYQDAKDMVDRAKQKVQDAKDNIKSVEENNQKGINRAQKHLDNARQNAKDNLIKVEGRVRKANESLQTKIKSKREYLNRLNERLTEAKRKEEDAYKNAVRYELVKENENGTWDENDLSLNENDIVSALGKDVDFERMGEKEKKKLIENIVSILTPHPTDKWIQYYKRVLSAEYVSGGTTIMKQFLDLFITFGDVHLMSEQSLIADAKKFITDIKDSDSLEGWETYEGDERIDILKKDFLEWLGAEIADPDVQGSSGELRYFKELGRVVKDYRSHGSYRKNLKMVIDSIAAATENSIDKKEWLDLAGQVAKGEVKDWTIPKLQLAENIVMTGLKVADKFNRLTTLKTRVEQLQEFNRNSPDKALAEATNILGDPELAKIALDDVKNKKLTQASKLLMYSILADKHPLNPAETSPITHGGTAAKLFTTFKSFAFKQSSRAMELAVIPAARSRIAKQQARDYFIKWKRAEKIANDTSLDKATREQARIEADKAKKQADYCKAEAVKARVHAIRGAKLYIAFTSIPAAMMGVAIDNALKAIGWKDERDDEEKSTIKKLMNYFVSEILSTISPFISAYDFAKAVDTRDPNRMFDSIARFPLSRLMKPIFSEAIDMIKGEDETTMEDWLDASPAFMQQLMGTEAWINED